jgi:two-component sensor histidine kinase
MTQEELKAYTALEDCDIRKIQEISAALPLIADLTGYDIFIDCRKKKEEELFVAEQAGPSDIGSSYSENVVGMQAKKSDEPAVYLAYEKKLPVRDLKATTQEQKKVKQRAVPILNSKKDVIAVLVGEEDISSELRTKKKLEEMQRRHPEPGVFLSEKPSVREKQELYHRVKNHLQIIMSIMNMQSRRCKNEEASRILRENVSRIMNMSALYELLMANEKEEISLTEYLEKMVSNVKAVMTTQKKIQIHILGDEVYILQSKAADIALIVNEILTNAYKYAFRYQEEGNIYITLKDGQEYWTVIVQDDGQPGPDQKKEGSGLGTELIKSLVHEKLQGKVYIAKSEKGTTVSFDIRK